MKNIETPNNNPFLGGLLFLLIIFAAVSLFAAAMMFADTPSGLGDGSGVGVFGSGVGDGTGTGKGSGSQEGESRGGDGVSDGKEDGKTDGEKGEGKLPAPEQEKKTDEETNAPATPAEKKAEKKADRKRKGEGSFVGEQIFIGGDTPGGAEPSAPAPSSAGKPSFSSGGRSVFKVKKHENALFVIDVSGSMSALTSERLARIEVLKIQLKAILNQQKNNGSVGKYGILAFSVGTTYFPAQGRQLRFGSRTDLEAAEKWIDQIDKLPRGGTPLFEALKKAVAMAKDKNMSIDAIYLLTDGEPTDVSDVNQYISMIKKELPRKVKIHTISIGMHSVLLEEIAKSSKGQYDRYQ